MTRRASGVGACTWPLCRHVALSLADPALPLAHAGGHSHRRLRWTALQLGTPARAIPDAHAAPLGARGRLSSRSPPGWLSRRRNTPPCRMNHPPLLSVL